MYIIDQQIDNPKPHNIRYICSKQKKDIYENSLHQHSQTHHLSLEG